MDPILEQQAIARRRALLDAMAQQSQAAPVVGAYGLPQALAKIATAFVNSRSQKALDAREETARGQYNEGLAGAVDKYLKTREGTPGATLSDAQAQDLMSNDQLPAGGLPDPVAANPRRAVIEAMSSRFPEMQAIGKAELGGLLKKGGGFKDSEVDGKIVRTFEDGRTQVLGDFKTKDQWEPAPDIVVDGRTIKVQKNKATGELKAVGSGQSITVQNTPEDKGQAEVLKTTVNQVSPKGESYEGARAATSNLRATTEALGAMRNGADMGALADFGQTLRKLGDRVGIASAATIPTDQLSSVLKERVFHKLGGLGVAISDADRKFMQESAGDISKDPVAMKRLLALDAAASIAEITAHNSRVEGLASRGSAYELLQNNAFRPNFNFAGDQDFAEMVARALAGKPTVDVAGAPGVPGAPAPAASAPVTSPSSKKPVRVQW